jgi:hypothetical protein
MNSYLLSMNACMCVYDFIYTMNSYTEFIVDTMNSYLPRIQIQAGRWTPGQPASELPRCSGTAGPSPGLRRGAGDQVDSDSGRPGLRLGLRRSSLRLGKRDLNSKLNAGLMTMELLSGNPHWWQTRSLGARPGAAARPTVALAQQLELRLRLRVGRGGRGLPAAVTVGIVVADRVSGTGRLCQSRRLHPC